MKNTVPKIIFFLMSAVGGAERMTVTFAKLLDKTKYNVLFYLLDCGKDRQIEDFIPKDYPVFYLPFSFGLSSKTVKTFYEVLKQEKPNIVFSSLTSINIRLLLLSPFFKSTKFVVRNNINLRNASISCGQKFLMRITYQFASAIIAQTEEMKKEFVEDLNIDDSKIEVIHNPVDTQTIDEKLQNYTPFMNSEKQNYVAVGRFAKGKAFDILVKAFNEVCKNNMSSELYIVGRYDESNEYYQSVRSLIEKLDLASRIHMVGFTDNPYQYMKNADCFVLSSRSEGLPNALIEALYIGTPAAACVCIPVIERIVEDGKTGFLAKPEDYDGLAHAMIKASRLGRIKSTYQATSFDKFLDLI